MKVEIKIPSIGESVSEATVSNILASSGSYVKAEQEILELETDKVNQALYAPQAGQLTLSVSVGQTVKIGQVIGFVDTDAKGSAPQQAVPAKSQEAPAPKKEMSPPPPSSSQGPSARKMADQFVADLKNPPAKTEIVQAPRTTSSGTQSRKKMSNLRKTIAQKLVEVKNTTAMLTTFNEVDMTAVMEIRAKEKDSFLERHGVKLGFMSFFTKAAVAALKAYPLVNSFIEGDEIVTFNTYDIGVAVSTEKGLFVPVVRGCDGLSFSGLESAIEKLARKAREGNISIDDLRGGSFTITNGGVFGSLLSTPILNPPQSAILGMHSIVKRAVVVDDQIVIRPMMYLALSYDHRIIDGKDAVLFLVHIKENLEDPSRLLLDL